MFYTRLRQVLATSRQLQGGARRGESAAFAIRLNLSLLRRIALRVSRACSLPRRTRIQSVTVARGIRYSMEQAHSEKRIRPYLRRSNSLASAIHAELGQMDQQFQVFPLEILCR